MGLDYTILYMWLPTAVCRTDIRKCLPSYLCCPASIMYIDTLPACSANCTTVILHCVLLYDLVYVSPPQCVSLLPYVCLHCQNTNASYHRKNQSKWGGCTGPVCVCVYDHFIFQWGISYQPWWLPPANVRTHSFTCWQQGMTKDTVKSIYISRTSYKWTATYPYAAAQINNNNYNPRVLSPPPPPTHKGQKRISSGWAGQTRRYLPSLFHNVSMFITWLYVCIGTCPVPLYPYSLPPDTEETKEVQEKMGIMVHYNVKIRCVVSFGS